MENFIKNFGEYGGFKTIKQVAARKFDGERNCELMEWLVEYIETGKIPTRCYARDYSEESFNKNKNFVKTWIKNGGK